ncbi:MAG: general secretion pathway protein GspK [Synergistaceae bacterium]|nr:general secretion pathway protein GspK [Synergistaceae bacterium]
MSLRALSFSRKRRGFVLVSVLMLGTLLISCATAFTWFVRMQARSTGRELQNITNRSLAHVMAGAVIGVIYQATNSMKYDSPLQRWFQPFVLNVPDSGVWIVQVTPLDDKLPLRHIFLPDGNTLRREIADPWREMWDKLHHRELEQTVLDFIDRNKKPRVGSSEHDEYINRMPYDISELLILSRDITPTILYGSGGELGLSDYCTIYSEGQINLNVAPVHVMEILPGLDTGGLAQRIAQARTEEPLTSMRDIQRIPGASPRTATQLTNIAGFRSRYFRMRLEYMEKEGDGGMSFNIIFDRSTRQIVRWEES